MVCFVGQFSLTFRAHDINIIFKVKRIFMEQLKILNTPERIKAVSDPRRLAILRWLMTQPMTISQLGREFNKPPSWIRHHIKVLEAVGLVHIDKIQVANGYIEKYYRADAGGYLLRQLIIPSESNVNTLIGIGSHDLALEIILEHQQRLSAQSRVVYLSHGSLEGLISLRQGLAQFSGCHLFDPVTREYNQPFVSHLFPDKSFKLVTLANRIQGLIFATGNPKAIHGLNDLIRKDITIINRNRGSGTRLWLDQQIKALAISPDQIHGYESEAKDHIEVVRIIQEGSADAGIGIKAAAISAGLGFIPLFIERFDLVFSSEQFENIAVRQLVDLISSKVSRDILESLPGYETNQTGVVIEIS